MTITPQEKAMRDKLVAEILDESVAPIRILGLTVSFVKAAANNPIVERIADVVDKTVKKELAAMQAEADKKKK